MIDIELIDYLKAKLLFSGTIFIIGLITITYMSIKERKGRG